MWSHIFSLDYILLISICLFVRFQPFISDDFGPNTAASINVVQAVLPNSVHGNHEQFFEPSPHHNSFNSFNNFGSYDNKFKFVDSFSKDIRWEYGFKPPLVPSVAIDEFGNPLHEHWLDTRVNLTPYQVQIKFVHITKVSLAKYWFHIITKAVRNRLIILPEIAFILKLTSHLVNIHVLSLNSNTFKLWKEFQFFFIFKFLISVFVLIHKLHFYTVSNTFTITNKSSFKKWVKLMFI